MVEGSRPSILVSKTITTLRIKGMTKLKMVSNFKDERIHRYFLGGKNPENVK